MLWLTTQSYLVVDQVCQFWSGKPQLILDPLDILVFLQAMFWFSDSRRYSRLILHVFPPISGRSSASFDTGWCKKPRSGCQLCLASRFWHQGILLKARANIVSFCSSSISPCPFFSTRQHKKFVEEPPSCPLHLLTKPYGWSFPSLSPLHVFHLAIFFCTLFPFRNNSISNPDLYMFLLVFTSLSFQSLYSFYSYLPYKLAHTIS